MRRLSLLLVACVAVNSWADEAPHVQPKKEKGPFEAAAETLGLQAEESAALDALHSMQERHARNKGELKLNDKSWRDKHVQFLLERLPEMTNLNARRAVVNKLCGYEPSSDRLVSALVSKDNCVAALKAVVKEAGEDERYYIEIIAKLAAPSERPPMRAMTHEEVSALALPLLKSSNAAVRRDAAEHLLDDEFFDKSAAGRAEAKKLFHLLKDDTSDEVINSAIRRGSDYSTIEMLQAFQLSARRDVRVQGLEATKALEKRLAAKKMGR